MRTRTFSVTLTQYTRQRASGVQALYRGGANGRVHANRSERVDLNGKPNVAANNAHVAKSNANSSSLLSAKRTQTDYHRLYRLSYHFTFAPATAPFLQRRAMAMSAERC
jgi:hypothetical protein